MNILGVSGLYHDSAAVIYVDGVLVAAVQEERFTRKKHDESFPINSIQFCLNKASIEIGDIDYVSFYDKPLLKFERILETHLSMAPKGIVSFINSMPIWMKEKMFFKKVLKDNFKKIGKVNWKKTKILFPEHHLSHAAGAYYPSGFKNAAILTVDGVGEWATTSICVGSDNDISVLKEINFPHSLGLLYSAFTSFLGFKVNSGEYKLMGLAPYGDINSERTKLYISKIKTELISLKNDGSYQLNLDYFKFTYSNKTCDNRKWNHLFGLKNRSEGDEITQKHCDLAIAIQEVTEQVMLGLAKEAKRLTGASNLCLSGGVALNCVANGVIQRSGLFEHVFIQPASGDAGGALGAALSAKHIYLGDVSNSKKSFSVYSGSEFSKEEIKNELQNLKADFKEVPNIESATAAELRKHKVIGWFQGKMEFGPRALGNRSIIADARNPKMRDFINEKVKHREIFRPFAPSILEEYSNKFFDISNSPFMLQVANSKKSKLIPSAIHVDETARVQTVNRSQNQNYYSIIKEFHKLTGVPVILNTSFNDAGEPLVETPQDAILCFLRTKIDCLVLNNILLFKNKQKNIENKIKKLDSIRSKKIKLDEKNLIKKFTIKYSENEYKKRKRKENLIARNYVLSKPISKINNFIKNFNSQNKPLLIIGSEDHTNILSKMFKLDINKTVFFDIKKNDIIKTKKKIHKFIKIKKIDFSKYYENIFISSFEYNEEIINKFKLKKYFTPYDNSSRSIIDYYYISKFSGKTKLHSKNIY